MHLKGVLIFPHQLFEEHPSLKSTKEKKLFLLLEDPLFFFDRHHPAYFHKQKLVLHRASMKAYADLLTSRGYSLFYGEASLLKEGKESYPPLFNSLHLTELEWVDPVDHLLEKRLLWAAEKNHLPYEVLDTPAFLNPTRLPSESSPQKKRYFFTSFYIEQRKRLGILLDENGSPIGGKWSFDQENQKKPKKNFYFPPLRRLPPSPYVEEAKEYVKKQFPDHYGSLENFNYPITHQEAQATLLDFLHERLTLFGDYEDAIVKQELTLMHSVLTPALNCGLITPALILEKLFEHEEKKEVPINSLEGFVRQLIGWREFMMTIYRSSHIKQRKSNFWNHHKKMPKAFYEGTTGILPVDTTIKKVKKNAYCHHIERLMVLGTFMLLCEIDPNEIYRWFMEFFIDAYDWVMVPNVYGMSQYADGGLITTKPYLCGSNYIRKMSDYPVGEWCEIWDALFWRFLKKHRSFFDKQPRLSLLTSQIDKMGEEKMRQHEERAEKYLSSLHRL